MLTIPSVLTLDNVVVYPDDENCNLFYMISTQPRIRMLDEDPVFSGLFWTDKADGTGDSTAGLGGGWINFDTNLGVSDELREKVKTELQKTGIQKAHRKKLLKQERERLALIAKAQGKSSPDEPEVQDVGEITFGSVNYTEGTVTLLEEKEGDIVPWSSAGGPASLIGDNNAAFALRLSADGAAIWYKALKDGAKAISVRYDLKFNVRLPSLEIRVWAGSTQKSEIDRKVDRTWKNVDKGCSDADVERINVKEIVSNLQEEGLVNIEIKKGSSQISDEHVAQLRNMAIKLIEEKVQEIIKSRVTGMTPEERKSSMLELIKEEVTSFVELRFTQRDVVEWPIAPQATIMNFLEDIDEDHKKHITKLVDLSDPEVSTAKLNIVVNAPWEEEPNVTTVKLDAEYPSAEETYSNIFKKDANTDTWMFRLPIQDDGLVKYSASVFFKGISAPLVLPVQSTNGAINVNIGRVGVVEVKFKPHPVLTTLGGKNQITSIQIDATYKDETADDHFNQTQILKLEDVEGKSIHKFTGKQIDAPLEYVVKYFTKGGAVIEMPKQKYYLSESDKGEVFTPSPFEDTLEIGVELGISPNDTLKKVLVEFEYEDPANDFESTAKVELSKEDDWDPVSTKLVQVDKEIKDFKYRYKVLGENSVARSKFITATGDQSLILPLLPVMIDPSRLKLGEDYQNAVIDLTYKDSNNDLTISHQIFMSPEDSAKKFTWYIPRMNSTLDEFTYSLTLFPESGDQEEILDQQGKGKFLILKSPKTV